MSATLCTATDTESTTRNNLTFSFEQSVEGSGYFMTYKDIQLYTPEVTPGQKGPALKDFAKGSGTIDTEVVLYAEDIFTKDEYDGLTETEEYACISMREDASMVYAPTTVTYGNGYYAQNPITYESLLKERTGIKNYRAATSMLHQVDYAKAIDKDLEVLVKDKNYELSDPIDQGVGYTSMKVTEDVTDGITHFGVLQGQAVASMSGSGYTIPQWTAKKDALIEINEDYVGTYHIEKNMTIEVPYKYEEIEEDWLSCCFGGCDDIEDPESYYGYNPCETCIFGVNA
jgi:hypothetical protein